MGGPPQRRRVGRPIKYTNGPIEAQILDRGKQGYLTDYFNLSPHVFYLRSLKLFVLFFLNKETVNQAIEGTQHKKTTLQIPSYSTNRNKLWGGGGGGK